MSEQVWSISDTVNHENSSYTEVHFALLELLHVDVVHGGKRERVYGSPNWEATRQSVVDTRLPCSLHTMAQQQLKTLYADLQRSFDSNPSDLKKCGTLLTKLKVRPSSRVISGSHVLKTTLDWPR